MKSHNILAALGIAALVAGCANTPKPTAVESNFGNSVRNMIEAQTYDPSTLSTPSTDVIESSDGQRLEAVLDAYRSDVAKPESIGQDIVINPDGQR
jgi:type IV pilus biogenesis protein CpaD/CtpE